MNDHQKLVLQVTNRLLISLGAMFILCLIVLAIFFATGLPVAGVALVMAFGMTGGFISIQRRLKSMADEDLQLLAESWAYVLLSPFSGAVLAIVLYCLFLSGMVQGNLFPIFEVGNEISDSAKSLTKLLASQPVEEADYAKAIVWAFIAGFSEKFVTNVLGTFTSGASAGRKKQET